MKSTGGPGWKAAIAQLRKKVEQGAHTNVGFLEGETYPDGTPVAQVAAWNEFGNKTAPPRPFMRNTIAHNKDKWPKMLAAALKASDFDVEKALGMCGEKMASQMREEIVAMDAPPNRPLTNLLKDRFPTGDYTKDDFLKAVTDLEAGETGPAGKPLVWSGQTLRSVTSEVKKGSGGD
ncbi:hypothetical protein [Acetobacter sp.]|uniref:hypothetical protein n=1 Tax=Acetobacter sp. TaxID=440 RepID=UPI0039E98B63